MKSRLLIVLIAAATLLSCTPGKNNTLAYFKNLGDAPSGTLPNPQGSYPMRVQPDDELLITITSVVPEATCVPRHSLARRPISSMMAVTS